jgi:hypothetical protein
MSENDKKISPEFKQAVVKYLEVDDKLREIKEKNKILTTEKKQNEEFILNYLVTIDENLIDLPDGKLKKNVSKSQGPLKKELIQKTLTEIVGDSIKANFMTDQIIKSRPITERITLKRTKNRKNN